MGGVILVVLIIAGLICIFLLIRFFMSESGDSNNRAAPISRLNLVGVITIILALAAFLLAFIPNLSMFQSVSVLTPAIPTFSNIDTVATYTPDPTYTPNPDDIQPTPTLRLLVTTPVEITEPVVELTAIEQTPGSTPTPNVDTPVPVVATIEQISSPTRATSLATPTPTPTQTPQVSSSGNSEIPAFPWPPPQFSAFESYRLKNSNQTMNDLSYKLEVVLAKAGYPSPTYYKLDDGFVAVSALERVDQSGRPLPDERWILELLPLHRRVGLTTFNALIDAYVRVLFGQDTGHYRMFVFAVTSQPLIQANSSMNQTQAKQMGSGGGSLLPVSIAAQSVTPSHRLHVFTYEYYQSGIGRDPIFITKSNVPVNDALRLCSIAIDYITQ